ncbi:hypothetical protein PUN28_008929 [Cardiocondyla obscurior]|uniref:Odorant receptor n=2 Tax=Cardiocondyla obscurior TaxID=286306 RepID=A0AAW2FUQ0_9HYME
MKSELSCCVLELYSDFSALEIKNLNYAFALSRQSLRLLGIWPDPFVPMSDSHRLSIRFVIVSCFLCLYVFMPQITNVMLAWGNITRMVENITAANYSLLALCKLISTWYHGKTLRGVMAMVMTDWLTSKNDGERNTMLNIARRGRTLSLRCYGVAGFGCMFFLFMNFLKFRRSMHQPQRILVYHFSYLYNINKSPNYEITFFIQILCGLYTALVNSSIDSFVSIILLHICAQLINLRTALRNVVDELAKGSISSSEFKKELGAITMRHINLISARHVFKIYGNLFIVSNHFNVSIIKMAFLLLYLGTVLTHLYIYCYSAERLLIESTSLAYGVYECKWYDISPKDAKSLMFMAYRSTIPLRLTAGKFGTFSLEMFGTTVKTSMGYLSALLTMMD